MCMAQEERCGDGKKNGTGAEEENCGNCPQDVPLCECGDDYCHPTECDRCAQDCDHKPLVCLDNPPTVICNQAKLIDPTTNNPFAR